MKKGTIKVISAVTACLMLMTGCKKMNCSRKDSHAHIFRNAEGFIECVVSEYERDGDFYWTEQAVPLSDEIKYEDKFDLLSINDNKDILLQEMIENKEHIEYEYKYDYILQIPCYAIDGKGNMYVSSTINCPMTDYLFTTDANHEDLTGRVSVVKYMYKGYKMIKGEDNNTNIVPSELTDNLNDVGKEFKYFKLNDYCTKVYGNPYVPEKNSVYQK